MILLPRNICARKWKESHPRGTTAEFKTYYDTLSTEDRQVCSLRSFYFLGADYMLSFDRSMSSYQYKW